MMTVVRVEGYSSEGDTLAIAVFSTKGKYPNLNKAAQKFYELNKDLPITSISLFCLFNATDEDAKNMINIAKIENEEPASSSIN